MKKVIMIIGAVVLAAAIAAGGFYGGMAYQRSQADATDDLRYWLDFLAMSAPKEGIAGGCRPGVR